MCVCVQPPKDFFRVRCAAAEVAGILPAAAAAAGRLQAVVEP